MQDHAPPPALTRLYKNNERLLIGAATLLVFLLAWEALAESGFIDPLFISSPTRVVLAGWGLVHDPDFWNDAAVSATEFCIGYGAAAAIAIPFGFAIGLSKRLQYLFGPFTDALNAVPRVTLLPLMIIWLGIGIWSKVAVVFLGALIPIAITTRSGARTSETSSCAWRAASQRRASSFSPVSCCPERCRSSLPG